MVRPYRGLPALSNVLQRVIPGMRSVDFTTVTARDGVLTTAATPAFVETLCMTWSEILRYGLPGNSRSPSIQVSADHSYMRVE